MQKRAFWCSVSIVVLAISAAAQTNTFPTSGNVGIGTTSPAYSLEVEGTVLNYGYPLHIVNQANDHSFINGMQIDAPNLDAGGNACLNLGVSGGANNGGSFCFGYLGTGSSSNSYNVYFYGSPSPVATFVANGNVGIGTTTPGAKLDVAGNIKISGSGASVTFPDGTVQSTAWTGSLCGGDYAESVKVTGERQQYAPGDVLVISEGDSSDVSKSTQPYSTVVAGIYSTKPGLIGRRQKTPKADAEVPMAMVGIVPTKVSTENGAIKRGDLLVTSSTEGYAMKGTDHSRMLGAVVGKALGSLASGTGTIEVLVSLQ